MKTGIQQTQKDTKAEKQEKHRAENQPPESVQHIKSSICRQSLSCPFLEKESGKLGYSLPLK